MAEYNGTSAWASSVCSKNEQANFFFTAPRRTSRLLLCKSIRGSSLSRATKKEGTIPSFFVAGMEGFEPPNAGTRTQCLTTWRHPTVLYGVTCRVDSTNCTTTRDETQEGTRLSLFVVFAVGLNGLLWCDNLSFFSRNCFTSKEAVYLKQEISTNGNPE